VPGDGASDVWYTYAPMQIPNSNREIILSSATRQIVAENTVLREVIRHDLVLQPEVVRFVREVWRVSNTEQTITAPLPDSYHGAFAPPHRVLRGSV